MKPSIGRIVHYASYGTPGGEYGKECRAAIVTEVEDDHTVGLFVANPTGTFHNQSVPLDDASAAERKGGTWHWPEQVPREAGGRPPRH
jgi:hypothetical protein